MTTNSRTREYAAKRMEDGLSQREIIRCLKRYVAPEVYRVLKNPRPAPRANDLRPLRLALGLTQAAATAFASRPTANSRIDAASPGTAKPFPDTVIGLSTGVGEQLTSIGESGAPHSYFALKNEMYHRERFASRRWSMFTMTPCIEVF